MNISFQEKIAVCFKANTDNSPATDTLKPLSDSNKDKKKEFLDKFETGVKNSSDLNDTIKVPRTIFKGYLAFMVSTTLVTLASFAKDKSKVLPKATNIASAMIALWGTYCFVRPYLLRQSGQAQQKSAEVAKP